MNPPRRVLELLGPSTGGIRQHVAALGARLPDEGWAPTFAGPAGVLDDLGIAAAVVSVPSSFAPGAILRAVRELRSLGRFDVVHAHGLKAGWVAVLSRTGAPVVLTIHNIVLDEVAGRSAGALRRIERFLVRRVDHVIAASPGIVEHFAGVVPSDRLTFVLPVSPVPEPERDRREVRRELGAGDDDVLVVVVARLHPQKDLATFVRAWRTVAEVRPDARAAIVGEGPDHDVLAALIEREGVASTLRLAGPSPHAIEQIAAADLLVVSSRWEAVPLVVVEAVQLGKPVVSTRVGVVEELVGEGGTVVDVGDADALAAAIGRYVEAPELRRSAGAISRERGTVIYGAAALVRQVARIYEEELGR